MKLFILPLYFWCNVFGEISEMPQWVNTSLFLVLWAFFCKKSHHFHGRHLWHGFGKVRWSQIFPWNCSWLNKNRFHEKEGGQFLHTNGIYCVLLAINSSKQRKDNQCLTVSQMVSSVCIMILWLVHNRNYKTVFFISLVDNHISLYF